MDLGSAAAPRLNDPAGALERLQNRSGAAFPRLLAARQYTAEQLASKRERLHGIECPDGASVVLFGSWARQELTEASDDDWAVLVESSDVDAVDVEQAVRGVFGQGDKKPGAQDAFGTTFSCDELVAQVGLEGDVNSLLTRRMLLLLESVPVLGGDAHARCWELVLHTYLDRGAKDYRPPRFLLNDLVRYWRTMCVDFEGKHWNGADDAKWVTRNAKLRTSRKLLFAAGLIPLLSAIAVPRDEQFAFISGQLRAVPTDRVAEAFLDFDAGRSVDAGARGLQAYDRFVELLADGRVRAELLGLTATTRDDSPVWREIKSLGDELQQSLLALLFGPSLSPVTRQFAIF